MKFLHYIQKDLQITIDDTHIFFMNKTKHFKVILCSF